MAQTIDFSAAKSAQPPLPRQPIVIAILISIILFAALTFFLSTEQNAVNDVGRFDTAIQVGGMLLVLGIVGLVVRRSRGLQRDVMRNFARSNGWDYQGSRTVSLKKTDLAGLLTADPVSVLYSISGTHEQVAFELSLLQGFVQTGVIGSNPPGIAYFTILKLPAGAATNPPSSDNIKLRTSSDAQYVIYAGNATRPEELQQLFSVAFKV